MQGTSWSWRMSLLTTAAVVLFVCLLCGPSQVQAFTLNVVNETGAPITGGFRWLVEEDTTHTVTPGALVADSLGVSIHRSYAPVVANGASTTASAAIAVPADTRYAVSVLSTSGNYTIGGGNVAVGQTAITVTLNTLPIPTAQISVHVFHDNNPINAAPDPTEQAFPGFSILIFDQGGQLTLDALGNPLGTSYNPDGTVAVMGDGSITTDANGEAFIKYIAPGKYGIRAVPPPGTNWIQTSTIEGTPGIDSWVKANEPTRLFEFGPALHHTFFGFVQPFNNLASLPNPSTTGNTSTVTGQVVALHSARPPATTLFLGNPVPECWIGLNTISGAGEGVYIAECNDDSTFTINNVPPGLYQIVTWDFPLDYIFGLSSFTVPDTGAPVDLGPVTMNSWFANYEGSVFFDPNQNGFRDPGEPGIANQNLNIRFRDGSVYQSMLTDPTGEFAFNEVFPFFKFMVYEVDFARFKPTGATIVVDDGGPLAPGAKNNPQLQPEYGNLPYRVELGPVLVETMMIFADQTNTIDWGKVPYTAGENGGISGMVFYDTTRAEDDPASNGGEPWQPGIPRVPVILYRDNLTNATKLPGADGIIDNINGVPGIQLADVDNYPFGWSDGSAAIGPEDVVRCGNGVAYCFGDALEVAATDSWDDNLPTGCVGPAQVVNGQSIIDCAETMQTWNQTRPAVFDGGYAFGFAAGGFIPAGTYIVEAVPPLGYEIVKEENKNVDFGDSYVPSLLLLPAPCVGDPHVVPAQLTLFPGVDAFYAGQTRPLCNMKQVVLGERENAATDFFMFTEVPKAARGVGLINNDLAIVLDPANPVFTEKNPASWVPVSVQDFRGAEILRTYTDEFGTYNFLAPSTYTINVPNPTGVSPNMLRLCLNHPGPIDNGLGTLITDPYYSPQFSQTCYTLDFWPGKITYLDTPLIPVAAFTGVTTATLDCELADGTPVLSDVTGTGAIGPYAAAAGATITITSPGSVPVTNPACGSFDPACSPTILRDFGFGATQGTVTVGNANLTITAWTNLTITGTVPGSMTTGQLTVTRGDNGKQSLYGITLTVGGSAPTVVVPGPGQPIQSAIDAAAPGALIIVRPGTYVENPIMWKNVRLQGSSAFSTRISAAPTTPENLQLWQARLDSLIAGGLVSLVPGENAAVIENAAGITVIADDGVFSSNPRGRIDGLTIAAATAGGGITVNGYAHFLEISNNRIINNAGTYAGGIRVGTPSLLDAACVDGNSNPTYCSSDNDNVSIHNNLIALNGAVGGVNGGGGVGIFAGSDLYQVTDNLICGNFTGNKGGGIIHLGLSDGGLIADNSIIFNESSFGTLIGGEGGGIFLSGQPAAGAFTGGLTPGTGSVTIDGNLIQGNLAGSGNGGGILASFVNGQDVFAAPADDANWYALDIFNNIIVNNLAGLAGGGIFLEDVAKATIVNNTISGNDSTATGAPALQGGATAASTPQGAGGITGSVHSPDLLGIAGFTQIFADPVLEDNIVWHNRSFYWDPAANGGIGGVVANATTPYWDLSVYGVEMVTPLYLSPVSSILSSLTPGDGADYTGDGNQAADPLFFFDYFNDLMAGSAPQEGGNFISVVFTPIKPYGDYHITSTSPAINQGAGAFLGQFAELAQDFDNETRPNGALPDVGADEFYAPGFARIIVQKVTVGGDNVFTFTPNYGAAFTLSSGQSNDSGALAAGNYSVSEAVLAGWQQTGATCSDGSNPNSINLAAGETVICTFTNTKLGMIIVHKVTAPTGDPQSFAFTSSYGAPFNLTDGLSNFSAALAPGTYSVSEAVPAGWDLTSAVCSNGNSPSAITIGQGQTVTCTFTNTKRGAIVIRKVTAPAGDPQSFSITPSYNGSIPFSLSHGQANTTLNLPTGLYSVSEAVPAGWVLTGSSCDNGSTASQIILAAGQTVTCTLTNTKLGRIVVRKVTLPASAQSFTFTPSYNGGVTFALSNGQSNDSGEMLPGTYSVTEATPAVGWRLASAGCDNGTDPAAVTLAAGQTVTCTFTNSLSSMSMIGYFHKGAWYLDADGNGVWNAFADTRYASFGAVTDIPITGDWNGDGRTEVGAFRAGTWYLDANGNGAWNAIGDTLIPSFGISTDVPITGDWSGTGTTKIGVFRNGAWLLDTDGTGTWNAAFDTLYSSFGAASDVPVTGDWNGDGTTEIGAFRNGTWYLDNGDGTWNAASDSTYVFGTVGDVPVTGDWNGDGTTDIGVFRGGKWLLDADGNGTWSAASDVIYTFGLPKHKPVTGNW